MNGGDMVTGQASHESHDDSNEDEGPTIDDGNVDERRDQIAQVMWDDYQRVCRERRNTRRIDGSTESDSSNDDSDDELYFVL
jgi:hypothetical protein